MITETESTAGQHHVAHADWFLQSLVNKADQSDLEVGITLQVSGMLVSGSLVSGRKYFEGFAADFSSWFANDPGAVESIKKSFSSYGETYKADTETYDDSPPPQYIHLKNARFFNTVGDPIPANKGVWWRGRLCEVGGFSLGSLSAAGGNG
jgi:hypothetical protein